MPMPPTNVVSRGQWVLFGLAAALAFPVNVLGYSQSWFHSVPLYDEGVHALTTFAFAGLAALAFMSRDPQWRPGGHAHLFSVIGIGLLGGLLWELFEYWVEIIGDRADTLMDLLLDGVGAAAAGAAIRMRASAR